MMYESTEVILFPVEGRTSRKAIGRVRTATARVKIGTHPSNVMSVARRIAARRNNQLISEMNLQARIETEQDGWYR